MLSDVMLATFTSTKFRGRKEAVLCDFSVNATTERNPAYLCSEENLIPNCQVNVALHFFSIGISIMNHANSAVTR